ncbi:hypothetical protein NSQ20_18575 [Paenibacillus sp. FSL K6-1122]|uniref:hypothetical protein n=1 Tax=unclassified Paenibacillus TaxID=185978 RepID=UPI0003E26E54|nr:hypothetical protein [Paenibacillus sp. FSL H7-689]ETT47723.1 hypothetical protein C170_20820 [Paenibacillus sp. FSL H7-689]
MNVTFTKVAGVSFIILSILRLTPYINVTGKWLLYISIAAFFLILYDLMEFVIKRIMASKGLKLSKVLSSFRPLFLGCAVMAIIVLPNIKVAISVKEVNTYSDFFTLISLGIAIMLLGFKTEREESTSLEKSKGNEIREFLNSTEGEMIIKKYIEEQTIENNKKLIS